TRVLVVAAVLDHELHLVVAGEALEIAPVVPAGFAAPGTLHVDNLHHLGRDPRDRPVAPGFEHHRPAAREQPLHQRIHLFLEQRFAAGDLHQPAAVSIHRVHDIVHRQLSAFMERIWGIAPRAAEIAGGEADEDAGLAGPRRLALNRIEDFVDRQHLNGSGLSAWAFGSGGPKPKPKALISIILPTWPSRPSTGSRPEPRVRTPEVFWTRQAW